LHGRANLCRALLELLPGLAFGAPGLMTAGAVLVQCSRAAPVPSARQSACSSSEHRGLSSTGGSSASRATPQCGCSATGRPVARAAALAAAAAGLGVALSRARRRGISSLLRRRKGYSFTARAALPIPAEDDGTLDIMPDSSSYVSDPCTVIEVIDDIAVVRRGVGLDLTIKAGTLVKFSGGAEGVLLAWKEEVGVVRVVPDEVFAGDRAIATEDAMETEASADLRGRILDPRGKPIDGQAPVTSETDKRTTFAEYKGVEERANQYRALFTGVLGLDFSVPVGRGQTMLFQGTNRDKDKEHLWPDLMSASKGNLADAAPGPEVCVCVCDNLAAAEELRAKLEERGCWDRCTLFVPDSETPAAGMVAMNAAVAFAEHFNDKNGEALVVMEFEPQSRVWAILSDAAGEERRAKGIIVNPKDEAWVQMEGTILRESISERRKFWFALISRATNTKGAGSVSILAWLWEREGGYDVRLQQAYEMRLQKIREIPRIDEILRERMIYKVEEEATAKGVIFDKEAPSDDLPGVLNAEIEELKSCTDGHVILLAPDSSNSDSEWGWHVDPYKSLPRIDALHPGLTSIKAHSLRLKMLQGRDRADLMHETLGADGMLDDPERLELKVIELILAQPAGALLKVEEEVALLAVASRCKAFEDADNNARNLKRLAEDLLASEVGQLAVADIQKSGELADGRRSVLLEEVERLTAA